MVVLITVRKNENVAYGLWPYRTRYDERLSQITTKYILLLCIINSFKPTLVLFYIFINFK